MSLSCSVEPLGSVGFPRVSGDEPLEKLVGKSDLPFSPRERG